MVWLPDGEKNFDDYIFICFDRNHERDRYTHRHTDRRRVTTQAALGKKQVTCKSIEFLKKEHVG